MTWAKMIDRCYNTKYHWYKNYGGRGIRVADEWLGEEGLRRFIADMEPRPDGLTLDRIENDGPYCKSNCRWATAKEQNTNARSNVLLTHNGKTMCQADWSKFLGVAPATIRKRLKQGLPMAQVLNNRG